MLVGRDAEVDALRKALGAHRVVVVTGPPGIGKSAIARAFGARDAIHVELAAARSADDALRTVARALAMPSPPAVDEEELTLRLARSIAHRGRVVVVLDDADRCRDAVALLLARCAEAAPSARFVVTSRAKLAVAGARRLGVGPLATADGVKLFARASERRLDAEDEEHVRAIVETLEGVPLAIELAAARASVLSPREIARLLGERLDLLEGGERSLRSAFALSWEELDGRDAATLAALSVFRGGFDVAAANAVVGGGGTAKDRIRTAEAIERLVDRSLVRTRDDGSRDQRHEISESLRVYAREKLEESGEAEAVRDRHARWFARLEGGVDDLERERANLDDALDHAIDSGDGALAARVLHATAPLALARGPLPAFVARIGGVLDLDPPADARAELRLLRGTGAIFQGRRDAALGDLRRARELAERSGDARTAALAWSKIGVVLGLKGRFADAEEAFARASKAAARTGDARTRGIVTKDRANVLAERGMSEEAMAELARARRLLRAAGDLREEGFVAMMMGMRLLDEGRLEDARRDCDAALGMLRRAGDRRSEAWTLAMLGLVAAESGDASAARSRLDASLAILRAVGDEQTEGLVTVYAGNVALEQGLLRDAEDRYASAVALLAKAGDRGAEGLAVAAAAAVDHELGRIGAAKEGFQRARALLREDGRPARRQALAALATMLDGEAAMRAAAADDSPAPEEVRFARRVLRRRIERRKGREAPRDGIVVVASDASSIRVGGSPPVRLDKTRPLARIVRALALERVRHPGRPVAAEQLVRTGWPGERIAPQAAKNRLHVTIARLRTMGLKDAIVRDLDGYLFDPDVDLVVDDL